MPGARNPDRLIAARGSVPDARAAGESPAGPPWRTRAAPHRGRRQCSPPPMRRSRSPPRTRRNRDRRRMARSHGTTSTRPSRTRTPRAEPGQPQRRPQRREVVVRGDMPHQVGQVLLVGAPTVQAQEHRTAGRRVAPASGPCHVAHRQRLAEPARHYGGFTSDQRLLLMLAHTHTISRPHFEHPSGLGYGHSYGWSEQERTPVGLTTGARKEREEERVQLSGTAAAPGQLLC